MDMQEFLRYLAQLATTAVLMSGNQNNPLAIPSNPFIAQSQRFGLFPSVTQDPSSPFNNSRNDLPSENSKTLKIAATTEQSSKTASTTGMAEAEGKETSIVGTLTSADKEHKVTAETSSSESSGTSTGEINF